MAAPDNEELPIVDDAKKAKTAAARAAVQAASQNYILAAITIARNAKSLIVIGIMIIAALFGLVLFVLMFPAALFISSLGPITDENEYMAEYVHGLEMSQAVIRHNYSIYIDDVAFPQAVNLKNSYEKGGEIICYVLPGSDDLSVSEATANKMMATYHVVKYYYEADENDDEGYRNDYYGDTGKVEYYSSSNSNYAMFRIAGINPNVQAYEYVIKPEERYIEYEERIVTRSVFLNPDLEGGQTGDDGVVTRTYVQKIPHEVVIPAVTETRHRGSITVNVVFEPKYFMQDELNALLKKEGGATINSNYKTKDYQNATATQKLICDQAAATQTTAQGYCALWVSNVFNGIAAIGGNACDMWQEYCYSRDYGELDVGMIVAVRSSNTSVLGQQFGHVGIYIGGGMVMDSTGKISTTTLESWIATYDRLGTVAWGYPPGVRAAVEMEVRERDTINAAKEKREESEEEDGDPSLEKVSAEQLRNAVVQYARSYISVTPYADKGKSLTEGTDAAGFARLVFSAFRIKLPTNPKRYKTAGIQVLKKDLLPGDIVIYGNGDSVAIYAGSGKVICCSPVENGVVQCDMGYRSDITAYVRMINDDQEYKVSASMLKYTSPAASVPVTEEIQKEIRDVAENLMLEFGLKGEDVFDTYPFLTEKTLEDIALICYREEGTLQGTAMQASYIANCFELYGADYGVGEAGLISYINYSGIAGTKAKKGDVDTVPRQAVEIVKKVLVEGYRVLPKYVDRKTAFGKGYTADLQGDEIDIKNKSLYKKWMTNIRPKGSQNAWTFYSFAPSTYSIFGYSSEDAREQKEEAYFSYGTWVYMGELPELGDTSQLREQIIEYAMSWVGVTPYVFWYNRMDYSGNITNSLITGTDCSGFVSLIFGHFGYSLPTGSASYQNDVGRKISSSELKPGDIIVYNNGSHVAIYAGDNKVIHCSSPDAGTVCYNRYYRTDETAYVRVIEEEDEFFYDRSFMGSYAVTGGTLTRSQAEQIYYSMAVPTKSRVAEMLYNYLGGDSNLVVCAIAWMEGEADYTADPYLGYLSASAILNQMLDSPSLYANGACWRTLRGWGSWYSQDMLYSRYNNARMASTFKCLYLALEYPCRTVHSCFGVDTAYKRYGITRSSAVYVSSIILSEGELTGVWR